MFTRQKLVSTLFASLIFISFVSYSQEGAKIKIEIPQGSTPWNNLNVNNNPTTFQFAIVSDRTGGNRPGVFLDAVKKLNLLQPEFVMSVGDLIKGNSEDPTELNREWNQFTGFIDSLHVPYFYVPGNHDISNKVMEDKWKELFGLTYYHFLYKDVLFLCLNSEDNYRETVDGAIKDEQFNYIKKVLEDNENAKWTVLFMHQPLWERKGSDTKRWKDIEKLLASRKHTVFVGHTHHYKKYERNNGKYIILATTGGGSTLRGPNFGDFDHLVWVTMTEEGPIIANLLLEGIWDEDVMTNDLADIVLPLSNQPSVSVEPIFIDRPDFGTEKTTLKISNSSDYDMDVDFKFISSKNMLVDQTKFKGKIKAKDMKIFNLQLKGINIRKFNNIDPLSMEVNLKYNLKDRPQLELNRVYNIKPVQKYKLLLAKKAIKIDGNLKEWKSLQFKLTEKSHIVADLFSHTGNDDGSGAFSICYDEENLYIGAEIVDDAIVVVENGENPLYHQDAVFIFLDARPVHKSCMGGTGQKIFSSDWITIAISPDEQGSIYRKQSLPKGTVCKIQLTKNGYSVEAAIPISYLNEIQISDWKNFRFNFMINDYDQGGQYKSKIYWKPGWTEKNNYIGSGTFFK